jgi:hypothetical protein
MTMRMFSQSAHIPDRKLEIHIRDAGYTCCNDLYFENPKHTSQPGDGEENGGEAQGNSPGDGEGDLGRRSHHAETLD